MANMDIGMNTGDLTTLEPKNQCTAMMVAAACFRSRDSDAGLAQLAKAIDMPSEMPSDIRQRLAVKLGRLRDGFRTGNRELVADARWDGPPVRITLIHGPDDPFANVTFEPNLADAWDDAVDAALQSQLNNVPGAGAPTPRGPTATSGR